VIEPSENPRILVFGAGAVGSLLGGLLSGAGYEVTLLGRDTAIKEARTHGLSIELHDRRFRTHPSAVSTLTGSSNRFKIVLLCVRSFAVERALVDIPNILADDGVLVTLQNGLGTEELVQERLPEIHHVAASLTLSADSPGPGVALSTSRSGGIALAPVSSSAPVGAVAAMFGESGIPVTVLDDYRSMKWSKLLLNQMANGVPAILDWTPGQVYRSPDVFRVEQAMLRETIRVMAADGARPVSLPGFPVPVLKWVLGMPPWIARRLLLRRVEGGRGDKLPSLLLDLKAGRRKLEADWLYGAVARRGAGAGLESPVNQRISVILNGIAINPDLRETFRNQPDRLVRNIQLTTSCHP
jgi:2-dehydropantoate 2-reductase